MKIIDEQVYYSWKDYALDMHDIESLEFDHVVGIYRGSLGIATHVSNVFKVPMSIVGFQTRDSEDKEPYWIHNATQSEHLGPYDKGSTILVVDDIYDTGHTMNNVMDYVEKMRNKPSAIGYCLFGKSNDRNIIYSQEHDGSWIVFPWETLDESV